MNKQNKSNFLYPVIVEYFSTSRITDVVVAAKSSSLNSTSVETMKICSFEAIKISRQTSITSSQKLTALYIHKAHFFESDSVMIIIPFEPKINWSQILFRHS